MFHLTLSCLNGFWEVRCNFYICSYRCKLFFPLVFPTIHVPEVQRNFSLKFNVRTLVELLEVQLTEWWIPLWLGSFRVFNSQTCPYFASRNSLTILQVFLLHTDFCLWVSAPISCDWFSVSACFSYQFLDSCLLYDFTYLIGLRSVVRHLNAKLNRLL